MKQVLHILTNENDVVATSVISQQRHETDLVVGTVDLTQATPDYAHLLEQIFAADSVTVW